MKEKRPVETKDRDPQFVDAEFSYSDRLALPAGLKKLIAEKGLVYRFLNAAEFSKNGNYHRSHWQPFVMSPEDMSEDTFGATPGGQIRRGDLILGVRPKSINDAHQKHLAGKRRAYNNFSKTKAKELRDDVRRKGLSDHVVVHEGYDDKP